MIVIEPLPSSSMAGALPLSRGDLQHFLAHAKKAIPLRGAVSLLLTGDAAIRDLNRRFRQIDKATDVLSFPAAEDQGQQGRSGPRIAGDLAISIETAARQAESFGHSLIVEVKVLMLHGLLHLAGLDHEADSGEMAKREQKLRRELELPVGLIHRNRGVVRQRTLTLAKQKAAASSRKGKVLQPLYPPLAKSLKDGAPVSRQVAVSATPKRRSKAL